MFTTIYRPKNINNFIGNKEVIAPFIKWLLDWDINNKKSKCMLLSGLCGIGKSLLVELILIKHNCNIINLTLDESRNKEYINDVIKPILNTRKTIDDRTNVLVVSDIDCGSDYGFISSLVECIKMSSIPIVCICENRYDQSIKPILNYCLDIKMTKPSYTDVYVLLYKVVIDEKIKIKEPKLREIYEQSNGDIRFILNTLQFGMHSQQKNVQSANIFETTGRLFTLSDNIETKYNSYWLSNDLHPLMVQENYVNNLLGYANDIMKLTNMAYSADALSDADIIESSVNMTNWELEPYVATNIINATLKCNKRSMMKFPQFLGKVSTMNKNKREKLNYEVANLLGEKPKTTANKEPKPTKVKEPKPTKVKEPKPTKVKEPKPTKVKDIKTTTSEDCQATTKKPRGRPKKDA